MECVVTLHTRTLTLPGSTTYIMPVKPLSSVGQIGTRNVSVFARAPKMSSSLHVFVGMLPKRMTPLNFMPGLLATEAGF